jgi:hypothetical protein
MTRAAHVCKCERGSCSRLGALRDVRLWKVLRVVEYFVCRKQKNNPGGFEDLRHRSLSHANGLFREFVHPVMLVQYSHCLRGDFHEVYYWSTPRSIHVRILESRNN